MFNFDVKTVAISVGSFVVGAIAGYMVKAHLDKKEANN